jgi:hypothetical protein
MDDYIQKLLYELLQFRRSTPESTEKFAELKHDADLCPRFQRKIEDIFGAFEKYHRITYDIQGPRDKGTDVLIRLPADDEDKFISLQVKSEDDLRDKNYLKSLKSQLFDTDPASSRLLDYYIVLCCNTNDRSNKAKVRSIGATFAKTPKVTIIEPEFALTFLRLTSIQVDALIKSRLGSEDIVFREALNDVKELTLTERALLFYLIWSKIYNDTATITVDKLNESEFLADVYSREYAAKSKRRYRFSDNVPDIISDLNHLEDTFISSDDQASYSISLTEVESLAVLMMDGRIRYEYGAEELLYYMMDLFGPTEGYDLSEEM